MRLHFRGIRKHLAASYKEEAERVLTTLFTQQTFFAQSTHIACYLAVNDELNCEHLIKAIWKANKHCYLPVLTQTKTLHFLRYQEQDALQLNRFSIPEPLSDAEEIPPHQLDCIIMPLIAFDKEGNRLGTGGGFYDRTLSFLINESRDKPHLIGVAFAAQETENIPTDPWDVAMQGVVTEKEVILFTRKN